MQTLSDASGFIMHAVDENDPSVVMFESTTFPGQYLTDWDAYPKHPITCGDCISVPTRVQWRIEIVTDGIGILLQ